MHGRAYQQRSRSYTGKTKSLHTGVLRCSSVAAMSSTFEQFMIPNVRICAYAVARRLLHLGSRRRSVDSGGKKDTLALVVLTVCNFFDLGNREAWRIFMFERALLLRLGVPLALLISTVSVAAQDTPVDPTAKAPAASATPAANDTAALAKATQNPVASLISVPLQNNSNFGIGPYNRTGDIFNIQPVIPMKLSDNVMLITRVIQPLVWQPYPSQPTGGQVGIGDMNPTFFLSPTHSGKLIYGAGPAFVLPTATSTQTGQGKFSIGPSVVALVQPGHWTVGVLINNLFSVAGSSHRPGVNQMLLQYFINYNLKKGYYLTSGPTLTANWNATGSTDAATGDDIPGGTWTVPFGGGVGQIRRLGFQPINWTLQFYGNAVHPPGASPWSFKFQIALLYPKMPKKPGS
jgi:hypothetical protein